MLFDLFSSTSAACSPVQMTPIGSESSNDNKDDKNSGISKPPPVGLEGQSVGPLHLAPGPSGQPSELADPDIVPPPGHGIQKKFTKDGRTNPGPFDKADGDALRVLRPDIFDGCRFEHNKGLGQQFTVSHSLWLGSALLPNGNMYQFGSTVVLNEGKTMLLGRMSDDMRLDAQIHHEFIQPQKIIGRIVSSIGNSSDQSVTHATLETNGLDYNANLKISKGPMFALSYFQSVTKWLNMGAEAFHHSGQGATHIFARANAQVNDKKDIVNATISTMGGLNLNYVRKVNERVCLAAELDYNLGSGKSAMNIGYEYLLRTCKINGVVSTDGTIQSQITESIAPGFNIIFNAILNHQADTHKFGYGVQIG